MKRLVQKNSNKGFTLVEVIISVAVLCIVCGIILRLFVSAGELGIKNSDIGKARIVALNRMETLKSSDQPFDMEVLDEGNVVWPVKLLEYYDSGWNRVQSSQNPAFVLSVKVKPYGDSIFTPESFGKDTEEGFFSPEPWIGTQNALNSGAGLLRLEPGVEWRWRIEIEPSRPGSPAAIPQEQSP